MKDLLQVSVTSQTEDLKEVTCSDTNVGLIITIITLVTCTVPIIKKESSMIVTEKTLNKRTNDTVMINNGTLYGKQHWAKPRPHSQKKKATKRVM